MGCRIARTLALVLVIGLAGTGSALAQTAQSVVAAASRAMGIERLNSIQMFGSATVGNLGQNNNAEGPWPRIAVADYSRWIDFNQPATRATGINFTPPNQGGASVQTPYNQIATPANLAWGNHLEIWTTPWGFLKGAAANNATVAPRTEGGVRYQIVTWSPPQRSPGGQPYKVVGYIGPDNMVRKVETWVEHPLFGDLKVETSFANWRDNNGLKFPTTIVQSRGGWPTFETQLLNVAANPADIRERLAPPAAPAGGGGGGAAPVVRSEQLAPGVWRIRTGHDSLAVEFQDHIVLYEPAPQGEARANLIMGEVRRVIPGKPIRYAVISHHHFDHTSGLPAVVAEGITIVTHQSSKALFERAMNAPRTLAPDAIAKSGKKPVIEGFVGDKRVFQDANHSLELHRVTGLSHADDLVLGYLPKEKILIFADMFSLGLPASPGVHPGNERTRVFLDNIERLGLQPERIVSVHPFNPDRFGTVQDIKTFLGR